MDTYRVAKGADVRIDIQGFRLLFAAIQQRGYTVIGPAVRDGVISYQPLNSVEDLPAGWTTEQQSGSYRVKRRCDDALFGYTSGLKSLKNFLQRSAITVFRRHRNSGPFKILREATTAPRYAFLGMRGCELAAIRIQDRVLQEDQDWDTFYRDTRRECLIVAVHCREAANTCFCKSMGTGPRVQGAFDLALTEFPAGDNHEFLVEVGSALGAEILNEIPFTESSAALREGAQAAIQHAETMIQRRLDLTGIADPLKDLENPRWEGVGEGCVGCGTCTMVCPTCFCTTFEDAREITVQNAGPIRNWDPCFTIEYSFIHGTASGVSNKMKYRQWLLHKLSYLADPFSTTACVGCGRCATWCPVGIDIIKEIEVLRTNQGRECATRG
jgi:ferredoxin